MNLVKTRSLMILITQPDQIFYPICQRQMSHDVVRYLAEMDEVVSGDADLSAETKKRLFQDQTRKRAFKECLI